MAHAVVPVDSTRWRPQYYVGLQALRFANEQPGFYQGLFPTIGGQLAPRWRMELAAWWRQSPTEETTETAVDGTVYRYASTSVRTAIPVLVRFSLVPHWRHWRVEALAGFVTLHRRTETLFSFTPVGQPSQPLALSSTDELNEAPLLLGAGISYDVTSHWSIRGEGSVNWSLLGGLFSGKGSPLQPGCGGGVHYNFGLFSRRRN